MFLVIQRSIDYFSVFSKILLEGPLSRIIICRYNHILTRSLQTFTVNGIKIDRNLEPDFKIFPSCFEIANEIAYSNMLDFKKC